MTLELLDQYLIARTLNGPVVNPLISVIKDQRGANIVVGSKLVPVETKTGKLAFHAEEAVVVFRGTIATIDDQSTAYLATTPTILHPRPGASFLVYWKDCPPLLQYNSDHVHIVCFDRFDGQSFVLAILTPNGKLFGTVPDRRSVANHGGRFVYEPNISEHILPPASREEMKRSVFAALQQL